MTKTDGEKPRPPWRLVDLPPSRRGGVAEILEERARQVAGEGRTPQHDDAVNTRGELAQAAAAYALSAAVTSGRRATADLSERVAAMLWPWGVASFKPRGRREDLIRAGALILAELEREQRQREKEAS